MTRISRRSFGSFLMVGGLATGLHYTIMYVLLQANLCSVAYASASGYALSTLLNYWANARFTFSGSHEHARSLPRFLLTAAAGLAINQTVLLALTHLGLPVVLSQILATTCVLAWNYIINAVWSFRSRHSS
jgi:putative flippase GtrA